MGLRYTSPMPKRLDVVAILRKQLKEVKASDSRLDEAISVLKRLGRGITRRGRVATRKISAAGRRRIAAAQRARWRKLRLVKK